STISTDAVGPGNTSSVGTGINSSGQICGYLIANGYWQAFSSAGATNSVNLLPNAFNANGPSNALALNDFSQVVGYAGDSAGVGRAFLYDDIYGMQSIEGPLSGTYSQAQAINNNGQVVGYATGTAGNRAFAWDPVNGMQDLNSL